MAKYYGWHCFLIDNRLNNDLGTSYKTFILKNILLVALKTRSNSSLK